MMFMPQRALRQLGRLPAWLPRWAALLACWWLVATALTVLAPLPPTLRVLASPLPQMAAGAVAQQAWFGVAAGPQAAQVVAPVSVLGVLGGGQGSRQDFAILLENGQKVAVRVGDKTPAGWLLLKVSGNAVLLRDSAGHEQNVTLTRQSAVQADPAANVAAPANGQPAGQMFAPPPAGNAAAASVTPVAPPVVVEAPRGNETRKD
jgi:hypothetical protein